MYERFFDLDDQPFRLTPDPKYLYLSEKHREAYAHLLYALQEGSGFVAVTGEIGTGKTTLVRALLHESPASISVAYIFNPVLTASELLQTINGEFGLPSRSSNKKELVSSLNEFLLAKKAEGGRAVVIVDEAQNLDPMVLEELRLLSNLETETDKLLQIILLGQPELRALLDRPELLQLSQRVDLRWHLEPLNREETHAYIRHRLSVAGGDPHVFEPRALDVVHDHSGGVPRLINILAHRSLLVGFTKGTRRVSPSEVSLAAVELEQGRMPLHVRRAGWLARLGVAAVVAVAAGGVAFMLVAPLVDQQVDSFSDRQTVAPRQEKTTAVRRTKSRRERGAKTDREHRATADGQRAADAHPRVEQTAPAAPAVTLAPLADAIAAGTAYDAASGAISRLLEVWSGRGLTDAERAAGTLDLQILGARRSLRYVAASMALEQLQQFNVPAVVELAPDRDQGRFALLEKLDEQTATLVMQHRVTVARDDLRRHWGGQVHMLWRDTRRLSGPLAPGTRGPAVLGLQSLLRESGLLAEEPTGTYDHTTRDAVRALQAKHALEQTGAADALTQLALYASLARFRYPTLLESTGVRVAGPDGS